MPNELNEKAYIRSFRRLHNAAMPRCTSNGHAQSLTTAVGVKKDWRSRSFSQALCQW